MVLYANGAPEEIRTPDPQIRSLGRILEIVEVCYRMKAAVGRILAAADALQKSLRDGDVLVLAHSDLREISSLRIHPRFGVREQSGSDRIVPGAEWNRETMGPEPRATATANASTGEANPVRPNARRRPHRTFEVLNGFSNAQPFRLTGSSR